MSSHPNQDDSLIFESNLFLNLNYVEKSFAFGDVHFKLKILDSACTDFDLTGQVIWPASYALAYWLLKERDHLKNEVLLELGSGTGITGLVAATVSKKVIVTDYNEVVLELLAENAKLNLSDGLICECSHLDWTQPESRTKFVQNGYKILIGSDIVYWYNMIIPLLETVDFLLENSPTSKFVLSFKHRAANTEDHLFKQATETFHFDIQDVPLESFMPSEEITQHQGVYLKIFTRKK